MGNQVYMANSSLDPLPTEIRKGMIAMGVLGSISVISTLSLIIFITYRMIHWKRYFTRPIARNQVFILIYNLLLADLQQALSFVISFWWLSQNKLVGPNRVCYAQGWLIQVGDVSSGLFVLSIAVHTFISVVAQKQIPHGVFVVAVCALWVFVLGLAVVGPAREPNDFFVPAGSWCWMGESHSAERLYLHYVWIFISQLGSLILYTYVFLYLRSRIASSKVPDAPSSASNADHYLHSHTDATTTTTISVGRPGSSPKAFAASRSRIMRTARYMVVYPFAYVALTLPLASARVSVMAGGTPPATFFPAAGTLMASCGFIDVLLYICTRHALFKSSLKRQSGFGFGTETANLTRFPDGRARTIQLTAMKHETPESAVPLKGGEITVTKNILMDDGRHNIGSSRRDRSDSIMSFNGNNEAGTQVSWMI